MIFQISFEDGTFTWESWSSSHPVGHPQQHSDLAASIQVNCNLTHFMITFHSQWSCDDDHYYHYQWHPRDGGHACRLPQGWRLDICLGGETWSHVRTHETFPPHLQKKQQEKWQFIFSDSLSCIYRGGWTCCWVFVSAVVVRNGQQHLYLILN